MQVLQRARGVDDVEIELEDIVEAARQSRMIKNPYKSILQRKYRPQLVVALIFMIFQQFDVSPRHLIIWLFVLAADTHLVNPAVRQCTIGVV